MQRIFSGGIYESQYGYCRAVIVGGFVHISGTTAQGANIPEDIESQCQSALETINGALREAGSDQSKIVRVNYYLQNAKDFPKCQNILQNFFGTHPPAATMIECNLIDPKYKIEIEVTALAPKD